MDFKTTFSIILFANIFANNASADKAENQTKHPQLMGILFGRIAGHNSAKNNSNFIGYFSQHHLKSYPYGSFISRMAGSIYLRENDEHFVKEATSFFASHSLKPNLARFNYWFGFCSSQQGFSGFCGNLGLSLFTWFPLEVANSYYGISSKLYYTSGYIDMGKNIEIQAGIDFESFISDCLHLNLTHAFLGLGFEFGL